MRVIKKYNVIQSWSIQMIPMLLFVLTEIPWAVSLNLPILSQGFELLYIYLILIKLHVQNNVRPNLTCLAHSAKCDRWTHALEPNFWVCPPSLAWILFIIASHFTSGGLPSITNTSFTPSRIKCSTRNKRFRRCGLATVCWSPFVPCASHIQMLKSTQSFLFWSVESSSFLLTGSSIFHRSCTPIWIFKLI